MVNKEEFVAWKASECYAELMKEIIANIENTGAAILNREVPDTDKDQLLRGYIKGLSAVVDWQPEFYEDKVEVEEMEDEV